MKIKYNMVHYIDKAALVVEIEKKIKQFVNDLVYNKLVNGIVGKAITKHFFELGLKAQKGK